MAAPPPSDIPNVFGMNEPQHMLTVRALDWGILSKDRQTKKHYLGADDSLILPRGSTLDHRNSPRSPL